MLRTYKNPTPERQVYSHLTHPELGCTLELGPGERVKLDLPDDFECATLIAVGRKPQTETTQGGGSEETETETGEDTTSSAGDETNTDNQEAAQ
ncbi:MAG: hypothetical protein KGL39_54950 [Patescibacteria group bacterium]|nr:hypothetical protein [Patescibacteria group bacterium]